MFFSRLFADQGVAREGQGIQGLGSRLPKQFFSQLGVVSSQLGWPFEVRVHGLEVGFCLMKQRHTYIHDMYCEVSL